MANNTLSNDHQGEALQQAAKYSKLGIKGLAEALDYTRPRLYRLFENEELPPDLLTKSAEALGISESQITGHSVTKLQKQVALQAAENGVPFYDVEFSAGKGGGFVDPRNISTPSMYLTLPEVIGCDCVMVAAGESMIDVIHPRDWIGIKQVFQFDLINFDHIYAIVTNDYFLIKYIKKPKGKSGKDMLLLRSANTEYEDWEIPKSSILQLFLVKVVVPFSKVRSLA